MRYLSSMVGIAPSLPADVEFSAVLAAAEPLISEIIDADGSLRVAVHADAFLCR